MTFTVESLNRDPIIWMGNPHLSVPFRIFSLGASVSPEEITPGRRILPGAGISGAKEGKEHRGLTPQGSAFSLTRVPSSDWAPGLQIPVPYGSKF